MSIGPIRTEKEYHIALARLREIWDAEENTQESDELEAIATMIEAYGATHYPMEPVDPLEELKYRLEEEGVSASDIQNIVAKVPGIKRSNQCDAVSQCRSVNSERQCSKKLSKNKPPRINF